MKPPVDLRLARRIREGAVEANFVVTPEVDGFVTLTIKTDEGFDSYTMNLSGAFALIVALARVTSEVEEMIRQRGGG